MFAAPARRSRHVVSVIGAVALCAIGVGLAGPAAALAADTTPPTAPGTITVSGVTADAASLSWVRSSDNVGIEGYRVYRGPASAADSALSLIATTDAVNSYAPKKLYSGTAYKFGIVAIDAANNKSAMRTVTLTTTAASDTTAPAAPSSSSVAVKAFSSSRLDVVWGASSSADVAGYQVIRDGTLVGTVDLPNGLRYSDNGLAAASAHTYVIKAVDSARNASTGTTGRAGTTLIAGRVQIARGPYLSNVTGTSAVVSWWTNIASPGVLTWGTSSATQNSKTDPAGSVQHHAVTITGLTPGTRYQYQVGDGAGVASAVASFPSAAAPGQTFKFASIGDFGGGGSGATQNANNIAGAGTDFIQTVGDNIYPTSGIPDPNFTTTYSDFDIRFYKPFGAAIKGQAFFPANGNKEYYGDGVFWSNFPMPGTNHSWYSYDWGDAHILVLDSEQPLATGSEQYAFAQSDLAAHQSAAWRIVAIQRPPYSSSSATSSATTVRQYLVPLFQQNKVDLVLSGNSHNYERSYPLIDGVQAAGGITYVVTGAGGNGFNNFTIAAPAWSAFREATYFEYARVTVSPTALTVDGIRADTNAVFDTTTITKGTTPAPSPPSGLTATPVGSTEIDLSWTASPSAGVTGYRVRRDGGAAVTVNAPQTAYKDTGLAAGSTHSYTVTAVDGNGTESTPVVASATTAGGGTVVTLAPTDDASINQVTPVNAGTGTRLTADNSPVVDFLLKFTVPSTCASVSSAKLTLTVGGGTDNGSVKGGDIFAAPDNGWSQSTVTWTSAPAKNGAAVASIGAVAINTAYTVDVSPLATGPGVVSIRVSTTSGDAAAYLSKEASATAGPRLAVTC
jgi:fibronectin type 3 domain-containing protein